MRHIYKRLLLSLTLIASSQVTTTYATNIRIVGPDGVSQTPVTSPEGISAANSEPSRFYGPTTAQETLWSISSRLRPSPSVSVQQTLLAIYRLNPQAFEDQNIHKLLPNSNLRIPSLSQVQSRTTETAIEIMDAHTKKLAQVPVAPPIAPKLAPVPQAVPKPVAPEPTPAPKAAVAPKPTTAPKAVVTEQKPAVAVSTPDSSEVIKLESELKSSQSELLSLEEKNHQLRLLLSNVQLEVDQLKEDISDKDRIRTEVERQLEIERNKQLEMESLKPSSLDNALSNNWLLAALACIPGLLAALAGMLILNRRNRNDESENSAEPVNAVPAEFFKEQESLGDEISLDDIAGDEDLLGDELLVDDLVENPIDSEVEEDDIFAGLDDDLDFNLDDEDDLFASIGDDGELDTELDSEFDNIESSNSGISVKGDDKALGLEEMERALDDASANNDNLVGFELSEDNVISNDEIEALLSDTKGNDPLETDEIEQSLLDDLFASAQEPDAQPSAVDKAIEQEEPEAFDEDLDVSDVYELADNLNSAVEDDIDAIFAQVAQEKAQSEGVDSTSNVELTDQSTDAAEVAEDEATVDDLFEEALLNLDDTSANELELDDNSTELLDELLAEEDSDLTSLELDEQALDNLELDDNSTELLDELLEAEDSSLDSLIIDEQAFDNLELDDNSTELLDELLDVEDSGLSDVALDD
ncbi:FimV/HubP family polar landmark protein, partial [Vibrio sp. 10N.286.49.B3]|uniref:FimV/HubP family polar landmark protein n=1 Tax=Vibrio sp. 10N.286.49.B3 TaxID=1880855 RepID=UPI0024117774